MPAAVWLPCGPGAEFIPLELLLQLLSAPPPPAPRDHGDECLAGLRADVVWAGEVRQQQGVLLESHLDAFISKFTPVLVLSAVFTFLLLFEITPSDS